MQLIIIKKPGFDCYAPDEITQAGRFASSFFLSFLLVKHCCISSVSVVIFFLLPTVPSPPADMLHAASNQAFMVQNNQGYVGNLPAYAGNSHMGNLPAYMAQGQIPLSESQFAMHANPISASDGNFAMNSDASKVSNASNAGGKFLSRRQFITLLEQRKVIPALATAEEVIPH